MPLYVPDQIDGQSVTWVVYPGGSNGAANPLGGLQTASWGYSDPTRIVLDTSGVKRYQHTDTDQVTWRASQFTIYKQTFAEAVGLASNPSVNYGTLNWKRFVFDLAENFARLDDTGNVVQAGGYYIRLAKLTDYTVSFNSPVEIIMTDVQGLAFGVAPKAWT